MDKVTDHDPAWDGLISWLQSKDAGFREKLLVCSKQIPGVGKGLFTTTDVPPGTPLFTIPSSAHINAQTLAPIYGSETSLTATQLISLHLFLHRSAQGEIQITRDPDFGPYISILPENFDFHPLSWLIMQNDMAFLVECMPPAARKALTAMSSRFYGDWKAVLKYLSLLPESAKAMSPSVFSSSTFLLEDHLPTFLWAWLNVNTRCVYHRICSSASDPNNITLCPLLDLANHTPVSINASSNPIPTFFSPSGYRLRKGDQVYLKYGSHSNITLFTEYGFIERDSPDGGQADVQDLMEDLINQKGALSEWIKNTLKEAHYWGDWTLYDTPAPPHPTYRLLPALRLMHISDPFVEDQKTGGGKSLSLDMHAWHKMVLGEIDIVSNENEEAVWKTLLEISAMISARAEGGLNQLRQHCQRNDNLWDGWRHYAVEAIEYLWLEEQRVANAFIAECQR